MPATPVARPFRIFAMMALSGVLMSLMVVFAKLAATGAPIIEIVFFRNLVGTLCLGFIILSDTRRTELLKTKRPVDHFWRGLAGLLGISFNFWAAKLLPLADATALFFSMPLIVTILAVPFLKEHVDWRRWISVVFGFVGILLIAHPGGQGGLSGIAVALIGACGTACSVVMVRKLGTSEPETRTVFYFFLFGAIVSAFILPWHWQTPDFETSVYLVATGLAGTLGQILLTRAYAEAPAGFLAPFNYLSIVYSAFFGWLIWNEWPQIAVFIGAGIVIAAGLTNLALEKTRARKAEAQVEVTYG